MQQGGRCQEPITPLSAMGPSEETSIRSWRNLAVPGRRLEGQILALKRHSKPLQFVLVLDMVRSLRGS
jgi:hypothetical protein